MFTALLVSLLLVTTGQELERMHGIPGALYDGCSSEQSHTCLALAEILTSRHGPETRRQAFYFYDRACDINWNVCPEAALAMRDLNLSDFSYDDMMWVNEQSGTLPEFILVENLQRSCMHAAEHLNEEAVLLETCLSVASLQLQGIGGGHAGHARGSLSRACTRFNSDDACIQLGDLLLDRFSFQKEAVGQALDLFRQSCRRGNDTSCDRIVRLTDY